MFNLQTVNDMEGFDSTKGGFNGTILPKGSGGGGGGAINVIDNLNSDSATDALSAKQGKALKGLVDGKVDKVTGKGLSTNDYTTEDKGKVATALQPSALTPYRTSSQQDDIDKAIRARLTTIEGKESGWDAKADADKVLTKEAQTLTNAEKAQVLENIGAIGEAATLMTINGTGVKKGDAVTTAETAIVVDGAMSDSSTNAVQNKVVKAYVDGINHPIAVTGSGNNADLDISDEDGNVLARFKNGHFQTKNFNSEDLKKHLKILVLGNSYSLDSFMYLPFILKEYGITISVGIYHRGGGLLSQLDEGFESASHTFYTIDTRTQTYWQEAGNKTPKQCVLYDSWDIITLQQGSIDSPDYDNYNPYTRNVMKKIISSTSKAFRFAWNININRHSSGASSTVEPQILSAIQSVYKEQGVNFCFPYGTAIFNARTDSVLNALGDGGEMWGSDQVHLQEGLPCYIAALANVQAIFNTFYPYLSVMGDKMRIDSTKTTAWHVKGGQGSVIGITEENCFKAQIAAINANKDNFNITTL